MPARTFRDARPATPDVRHVPVPARTVRDAGPGPDLHILTLATSQHGIVTSAQLLQAGLGSAAVSRRAAAGRLVRLYRGVYAVGHGAVSCEGRAMAAVLAAGPGAVLGGMSAAWLWGISTRAPATVEVVSPRRHRPIAGARVRFTRTLDARDTTVRNGIPVTTVPRLLVDLAERLGAHRIANLMHEAAFHERLDLAELERCIDRLRGRHGQPRIAAALELHRTGSAGTRSRLEERFLERALAAGAPMPAVNTRLRIPGGRIEVDFAWRAHLLCVEVDGPGHRRPRARRTDAERDARLAAAGWRVIRVRADDLPRGVRATMRALASPAGGPARGASATSR